ncbi:MAG TPA: MFS transporter, partial [Opitutaceae bacterium]
MELVSEWKHLTRSQRAAIIASLLGWTLDAFDYFLVVFIIKTIATDFHSEVKEVAYALTLTLMFRPLGALVFGWLADCFGRRPILMIDVVLFSICELASAFAPSLTAFLILRALFGFFMGGEWGIGSSLVMESVPTKTRGMVSGILQEGYALGYLLAAIAYGLLFDSVGWRGLLMVGVVPAVLVLYIRLAVEESPAWEQQRTKPKQISLVASLQAHWKLFIFVILLMAGFNFFSHGTQDLFPTFLQVQRKFSTHTVSAISIAANVGAIVGGVYFGQWSQKVGRKRAIITACLLVLPVIPLWTFTTTPVLLGAGAFLLQVMVQGAWGVIPAHLNELSPAEVRGTFPGFAYQLGNLLASKNAVFQAQIAEKHDGNYALALAIFGGVFA